MTWHLPPVFALALTLGAAAAASPVPWHLFRDTAGFTVRYPGTWVRFGDPDHLALRSSPDGVEGVIIKPGQAYLWVAANQSKHLSLDVAIARYTHSVDAVLVRRNLPAGPDPGACGGLTEVITREPIVPREDALLSPPEVINDHYFCVTDGHLIIATGRYYATDRHAPIYQMTLRQVAQSIRVGESEACDLMRRQLDQALCLSGGSRQAIASAPHGA